MTSYAGSYTSKTDPHHYLRLADQLDRIACLAVGGPQCKSVSAIAVHLPQSICQEMATPTRLGW